jgi:hypothetical protein
MERHGYRSVVAERIRAEHQARAEARLQRAAQHEQTAAPPRSPKDIATESAFRWAAEYGRTPEVQPKSQEEVAKESAQKWLRYRQAQEEQEAQAQGRKQTASTPSSAKRARTKDHDHSL